MTIEAPIVGVRAAMPAASTANTGRYFWATDVKRLFLSTGAAWVAQGADIAVAENTGSSTVNTANNGYTDAGLSVIAPKNCGPHVVKFDATYIQQNTALRLTAVQIATAAGAELQTAFIRPINAGDGAPVSVETSLQANPAADTTYKVRLGNIGGAGTSFWALGSSVNAARLRVVPR